MPYIAYFYTTNNTYYIQHGKGVYGNFTTTSKKAAREFQDRELDLAKQFLRDAIREHPGNETLLSHHVTPIGYFR